ncbi:putative acetyltransferase protein [Phaeoacremonium minimum UCRPA7]|uniref:Putative acetyltransferase protein n=1 Tax=Phaeoacremonium minimum (strain UCR-PA7) TaxID=1286976 RepID=R8B9L2_PHAM7|nr:putative acetyltransferase protein [Phaeoacremonium minimum UCRPA7]EON95976.1 putative acetyltransferase protein [Phaeoacremonium minimum UCRPA7]
MGVTQLTFRKAAPSDVPLLLPLIKSAYRGDASRAGWTSEADLVADDRIDEAGLLVKINAPQGAVLLAHDCAGNLAACCELLKKNSETAHFGLFAVDPARQAGGIGRQVLERAELYARDAWGVSRLEMSVIWTREELIAWYIRRGFERTGKKAPFPYAHLVNGSALRDDLYFDVLAKGI